MAKKAEEIAPFEILARIHFNLQVAVCPAKIWSVLCTYHNYINPNTHQSPGLPVMLVCATRGVHLSKQIDLMAEVTAIVIVVPMLDPRNAGANAARGEDDEVGNMAIVGACAAGAAESKGDGVGGAPQLEPHEAGAVEEESGVKGV
jgi:hypothetical protein